MSAMEQAVQHAILSMLSKAVPQDQLAGGFQKIVNLANTLEDIRDTLHRIEENGRGSGNGQLRLISGVGPDDVGSPGGGLSRGRGGSS